MFIQKLTIKDFRSHAMNWFEFGALNLIRGPNASGKTSIAQAIEFLLTGRCLGTDEAGKGAAGLVRNGSRSAVVEGQLSAKASDSDVNKAVTVSLMRERSTAGSNCTLKMEGRTYAGRQVEEFLSKWGWSKAGLSCVLRPGRFIELPPAEQKTLLAEVLQPDPVTVPAEIRAAMATCMSGWEFEALDLDGLREVEEGAIKLRAECTAALREMGEPAPPPEPKTKGNSEIVRAKLDDLRADQGRLVAKKEKLENEWAEKSRRARQLPDLIAHCAERILHEDTERRNLDTVANEQKIGSAQLELARLEVEIQSNSKIIGMLEAHPGVCPTCKQNWNVSEQLEGGKAILGELRQKHSAVRSFLDGQADVADAKLRLAQHREAIIAKDKLEKELKELKVGEPPNTKKLDEEIATLEERIKKGQSVLSERAGYESALEAHQAHVRRRQETEARRAAADVLAKWAGPNGAQAQMTAGKLPAFIAQINSVLEVFGYDCTIEMEPYRILVRRRVAGSPNLELGALSESEQWRFSLGFQAALARATGVNCIVLDRADVLVGSQRGALLKTVLGLGLDQVFLLASTEDFRPMPPAFTTFDLSLSEAGETKVTKGG